MLKGDALAQTSVRDAKTTAGVLLNVVLTIVSFEHPLIVVAVYIMV